MAEFLVERIEKDHLDSNSALVDIIYAKVTGRYASYRADGRVLIQWADLATKADPPDVVALGIRQREALSPLFPLRGEINGLIDGWRSEDQWLGRARNQARARRFDRLVADALAVALAGNVAHAREQLTAVRDTIFGERMIRGRTQYAAVALVVALGVALLSYVVGSHYADLDITTSCRGAPCWDGEVVQRWAAAGFGAFGAFLSLALGITSREVMLDLQRSNNVINAWLRIAVGAMSAVTLVALLQARLIQVGTLGGTLTLNAVIAVAIIAGFTERLVSNAISQVTVRSIPGASAPGARPGTATRSGEGEPGGGPPPRAPAAPGPVRAPAGDEGGSVPVDDHAQGYLAGHAPDPDHATDDVELPEETGGVAQEKP